MFKIWEETLNSTIKNWYAEVQLPDTIWSYEISALHKGVISNKMKINVIWSRPEITKIDGITYENQEALSISVKWLSKVLTDNILYINSKQITPLVINEWLIIISKSILSTWKNIFEVKSWSLYSEMYIYHNWDIVLPSIWTVEPWVATNWNREFKIYVNNFNKNTDSIYFWTSKIEPIACYSNICRVSVADSVLSWYFMIWRNDNINYLRSEFDISKERMMSVKNIIFSWKLERWIDVKISWNNLDWATVSATNLFTKNTDWTFDIKQSSSNITGYLPTDFDNTKDMSFSISKNNQTISITFNEKLLGSDLTLKWPALIKSIEASDKSIIKEWSTVLVDWDWITDGDTVVIWDVKTQIIYKTWETPYFIVPKILSYWAKTLKILNSDGIESNTYNFILANPTETNTVNFEYKTIDNNNFYIDDTKSLSNVLFKMDVLSSLQDIYIPKLSFNVKDLNWNKVNKLWTFKLLVWSDTYWPSIIDENWNIEFQNIYLTKSINSINVSLFKVSNFLSNTKLDITLNNSDFSILTRDFKALNNQKFIWINSSKLNILSDTLTCVDSDTTNINCNAYYAKNSAVNNTNTVSASDNDKTVISNVNNSSSTNTNITKKLTIKTQNYNTKLMKTLSEKLINLWEKLASKDSNKNNISKIEESINNLLSGLYHYENSTKWTSKRKFADNILNKEIANLVKY